MTKRRQATGRPALPPVLGALLVLTAVAGVPSRLGAAVRPSPGKVESIHVSRGDAQDLRIPLRNLRARAREFTAPRAAEAGRDVGSITVLEYDDPDLSTYDRNDASGEINYLPRAAVARRFYATHGDLYDFLVIFTNFEFDTGPATAFFSGVRNREQGTGRPLLDSRQGEVFGSPARLKGYIDMAALSRYSRAPLSIDPSSPGFARTVGVLLHEVGHQWLAQARYRNQGGQVSSDLLGRDGAHWSYLLDSDASHLYGSEWTPGAGGVYTASRILSAYSPLDLYLMGFLPPSRVGPITLLRNGAVDPTGLPVEGASVTATAETVAIGQITDPAALGPRVPDERFSQKDLRLGFIFLTSPGSQATGEELAAVDRVREAFAAAFFAQTHGVAVADTTLAEAPPTAPGPAPDLDRALAWLLARQQIDGRWEDGAGTPIRDTSAGLAAVSEAGLAGGPLDRGRSWLAAQQPANTDFVARRELALAPVRTAAERREQALRLLAGQGGDGGFGAGPGYESDPLDTALALQAVFVLGHPADAAVRRALTYLAGAQHASGGWPLAPGGEPSTLATAEALLALQPWRDQPEAAALIGPALAGLLARRNPDGGFGESPSTAYGTALALRALLEAGAAPVSVDPSIAWLEGAQLADGSWEGTAYATGIALAALRGATAPNLVVPQDGLRLQPEAPREGDLVTVTATVVNAGRRPVPATRARLFDGLPSGPGVGDASVPELSPGAAADVTFSFDTGGRPGDRTLYVVADPDGEVPEARENDNAASRAVHVDGLLADLAVRPGDLVVVPDPPLEGEVAQVAITVRNEGLRDAPPSLVRLYDGAPSAGGRLIGTRTAPAVPPGQSAAALLEWDTTGALGPHVLFAQLNADGAVPEGDTANNTLALPVDVVANLAPVDLAVDSVSLSPSSLTTIPQSIEARLTVRNLGSEAVATTVALYDGEPGASAPLAASPVSLPPRSSAPLAFTVTVEQSGGRRLTAVADPDGLVGEPKGNNRASAWLADPADTVDVEVPGSGVVAAPDDLTLGEPLVVTAVVRNRGTAPVPRVPVLLVDKGVTPPRELARTEVGLGPGGTDTAVLTWTTSLTGDPRPLAVVADPFDLLVELSEANNEAPLAVRIRPSALPNLVVSGDELTLSPDPPREGAPATLAAVVRNPGSAIAEPSTLVFYRGDPDQGGTPIGEPALVPALAPGEAATVSHLWSPVDARGVQGIFAVVDPLGQVAEYDETDNRAFRPFRIVGLPDLVVTTAGVALDPPFPRAAEAVTVRATVTNQGETATGATVLRAAEVRAAATIPIGDAPVPGLEPGGSATIEVAWTPAAPAGERTLAVEVDPANEVIEQSEGNNAARRAVVVQDADLYLSQPFFSPNGDGVQDDTTLGYRAAAGSLAIVVSDERGDLVRSLAEEAPATGSVTWDGRRDDGRMLPDGTYTLSVLGQGGIPLGRATAVLDTNRSPIHDAAASGLVVERTVTCGVPDGADLAWLTAEDGMLVLNRATSPEMPVGLGRVDLAGSLDLLFADDWYGAAAFASEAPVSPDGREVLLVHGSDLVAVDLSNGGRRTLTYADRGAHWSPDGRFIADETRVILAADASLVAELPPASAFAFGHESWAWSPDSARLAAGNQVYRRDGTLDREVALPQGVGDLLDTAWRGDGKVVARYGQCGDGCENVTAWLLDPDTGDAAEIGWLAGSWWRGKPAWSPDGHRVVHNPDGAVVALEDGSSPRPLTRAAVMVSPRSSAASYVTRRLGASACPGSRFEDEVAVTSLQNLTAELRVSALPGNSGLVIKGTAADRNLDFVQLDYATPAEPGVWRPLGPATDAAVVDELMAVFAPPAPGTYAIRLRVRDRAGYEKSRTEVVAWDRVPVLANLTQSDVFLSPGGARPTVRFDYLVQEPTRVEARVVGPARARDDDPGALPTVWRRSIEHPVIGPGGFSWDGRDDRGAFVPDGRYTVLINEMPFRVEVDGTPPEISWRYENLRADTVRSRICPPPLPGGPVVDVGAHVVDQYAHVVDSHLKGWAFEGSLLSRELIFEPERDSEGKPLLNPDGTFRVLRAAGRPVDVLAARRLDRNRAQVLTAEDQAGNVSSISVPPVEERLSLVEARLTGACGDDFPRVLPPISAAGVHHLDPRTTFLLGDSRVDPPAGATVFRYRPRGGAGDWAEVPSNARGSSGWEADLPGLGLVPGLDYESRFVAPGGAGPLTSEPFSFRVCREFASLGVRLDDLAPGSPLATYVVSVGTALTEPVVGVALTVRGRGQPVDGLFFETAMRVSPDGAAAGYAFTAPRLSCSLTPDALLGFEAVIRTASGRILRSDGACLKLASQLPECESGLELEQVFSYCKASPDEIQVRAAGISPRAGEVTLERGGESSPILVDRFDVGPGFDVVRTLDASPLPSGVFELRGRLTVADDPNGLLTAGAKIDAVVDRTPPGVEVLEPAEGGAICVSKDASGREAAQLTLLPEDDGPKIKLSEAAYRREGGDWTPIDLTCPEDPRSCRTDLEEARVLVGDLRRWSFEVTGKPEGDYALRLTFCDRAGNQTTSLRRFRIQREPPGVSIGPASRTVLAPGVATTAPVLLPQSLRVSVEARRGTADGPLARSILADVALNAGSHPVTWDGLDGQGAPVAEGEYLLVARVRDACGRESAATTPVVVDRTPPSVAITRPASSESVDATVDVIGTATDAHFRSYELSFGAGAAPATWIAVPPAATGEVMAGLLGRWETPGTPGPHTLRLLAIDEADNQAEARVTVNVGTGSFVRALSADPPFFSPNGDSRADTTLLGYRLGSAARAFLEVRDAQGAALMTFPPREVAAEEAVGAPWDGLTDAGTPAPEGDLVVALRVESPAGSTVQERVAALVLDRTPPSITIAQPPVGGIVPRSSAVLGSIEDPRLSSYTVTADTPAGPVELGRGAQSRSGAVLGRLDALSDGPRSLTVAAEDAARNLASTTVAFQVDSTPPEVRIQSPAAGAVLKRDGGPIGVVASVTDANLESATLRAGIGTPPAVLDVVGQSSTGGESVAFGPWAVGGLPDGPYTLALEGRDRAGLVSEGRIAVVLDGTAPLARIDAPAEGGYVTLPSPVAGSAADPNLTTWTLESAPGPAASAFAFTPLASGTNSVDASTLAAWDPLPPDGVHTLRLIVKDGANHTSTVLRTLTVDTLPPARPAGLRAEVVRTSASAAEVRLTWNPNPEPDLGGYVVTFEPAASESDLLAGAVFVDPGRGEGLHRYRVVARDRAGNVSEPAAIDVPVDLTPPTLAFMRPLAGAFVSGGVEVVGTAFAPEDLAEYRLLVGATASPATWTLLNRSTVPVAAGPLGSWTPLQEGPHVLALEAEDRSGNQARITLPVVVDLQPPAAPVLTAVDDIAGQPDALRVAFTPSASADVRGYLVYRNGRLANGAGVVLGDLSAYLVTGPSHDDLGLPDGAHCYRVVAMDLAGNESPPSNEICRALDNRPPAAVVTDPAAGRRFELPIRVAALSPDRDIASVRFEWKRPADAGFSPLGSPDPLEPFETVLDPAVLGLAFGPLSLRAVATDTGGRTDPAPAVIDVVYGDSTAPAAPTGLDALVDGQSVHLTWNANLEGDLAGYHVWRDGVRVTAVPVPSPAFDEAGVPLGRHDYAVTAVDAEGNEGVSSTAAEALVYAVRLLSPFPVTTLPAAALQGRGGKAGTTAQALSGEIVVGESPVVGDAFAIETVALREGANFLRARGVDPRGNRSATSDEVVLVSNRAPPAVTGLRATVDGRDVTLAWDPSAVPEVVGYRIRRDGEWLTTSTREAQAFGFDASDRLDLAPRAFDGSPATAWVPDGGALPASWEVQFFGSVLVESVAVRFLAPAEGTARSYRIEAFWEDRFVPLVEVRQSAALYAEHVLPSAFSMSRLRFVLEEGSGAGLSELEVTRRDVVSADPPSFVDVSLSDGVHRYEVSALDRYGAEGPAASVEAPVGDVTPPGVPTGLAATVEDHDVELSWTSPGADAASYDVLRDGVVIASSPVPSYQDAGRPNGVYRYTVRAVDSVGNASADSEPADAVVAVAAPAAPVLAAVARPEGDVQLDWTHPGAASFVVSRGTASGGPYATLAFTGDVRSYRDGAATRGVANFYVVQARDGAGNLSGPSNEASAIPARTAPPAAPIILFPTDADNPIEIASTRTDVRGRAEAETSVAVFVGGVFRGSAPAVPSFFEQSGVPIPPEAQEVTLSNDGRRLAYSLAGGERMEVVETATGQKREVPAAPSLLLFRPRFSPDGDSLAFLAASAAGQVELQILDLVTGERRTGPSDVVEFAWSPDQARIAFTVAAVAGGDELRLLDLGTSEVRTVDVLLDRTRRALRFAPDGERLAYVVVRPETEERLRVLDLRSYATLDLGLASNALGEPGWSPDGRQIAYDRSTGQARVVAVVDIEGGQERVLSEPGADVRAARFGPNGTEVSWVRRTTDGSGQAVDRLVALDLATGRPREIAPPTPVLEHAWLSDGRLGLIREGRYSIHATESGFEVGQVPLASGENQLTARATDASTGLSSADSRAVQVTVAAAFPDLQVLPEDLAAYPALPVLGQPATLSGRIRNVGAAAAASVSAQLTLSDAAGSVVSTRAAALPDIPPGASASVSLAWTPSASGAYRLRIEVDAVGALVEAREDNNTAEREVTVVAAARLAVTLGADQETYAADTSAALSVRLLDAGPAVQGTARTTVEDPAGTEVAVIDTRAVSLAFGQGLDYALAWNTGRSYAGDYRFRVVVTDLASPGAVAAEASTPFRILADLRLTARLVPETLRVVEGQALDFMARAENAGVNAPLLGGRTVLQVSPELGGPAVFSSETTLPTLLPGAAWEGALRWPSAAPAGTYRAELRAVDASGTTLAAASAAFAVDPAGRLLTGALSLTSEDVLPGDALSAAVSVTNAGPTSETALPLAVEVVAPSSSVLLRQTLALDVPPGDTRTAAVPLATAGLPVGKLLVFLRVEGAEASLDRALLHVHGPLSPPSVDQPADGARVPSSRPSLTVSNASSAEAAALTYSFRLFGDPGLTQPLRAADGVAEQVSRTPWPVPITLGEDATYYWRARATDGFSVSAWTPVASFTVDEVDLPPSSPRPDTPRPGERTPSRQPRLTVLDATDPEREPLTYEFRIATDGGMASVVASAAGVPEAPGRTSWTVSTLLDEDATYHWAARASDGTNLSAWSVPVAFTVDAENLPPSPPELVRPIGGVSVRDLEPELVARGSQDPEGAPLFYSFEVDSDPSFASPDKQSSLPVADAGETGWRPPLALRDNTRYHWRAAASDGQTTGVWMAESFFVNLANEAPGAPVPLDPVDGRAVGTATPVLRLRNAVDPDLDRLTYDFAVTDGAGSTVAEATGVVEGLSETTWTLTPALAENQAYSWSARARDGEAAGPWSPPAAFRVNAVDEPPTAPALVAPAEGSTVGTTRPDLVVANAVSPDGLGLTYAFELYSEGSGGELTLLESAVGVAEGTDRTSFVPSGALADGPYAWRARADDGRQPGPWMPTARFTVAVDPPPGPPAGLQATPGDGRVSLSWSPSPEPDVVAYGVYRGASSGGPYAFLADAAGPAFEDVGLPNDVTVYYVVTAKDARFESALSAEVAATPRPPVVVVPAEVRFFPDRLGVECLAPACRSAGSSGVDCPWMLLATIELPPGRSPSTIDLAGVRLADVVAADRGYARIVDKDDDGQAELEVRFPFGEVAPLLQAGTNLVSVSGLTEGAPFRGSGPIEVEPARADLWITPRAFSRTGHSPDVQARLTFAKGVDASLVDLGSLRLNESVPVKAVVSASGNRLTVRFDRAAVNAVLPVGHDVEVRVSGRLFGTDFLARDLVRVKP